MGRRVGETFTAADFWKYAFAHAKMVPTVMGILGFLSVVGWKAYGQDKLQEEIDKKIAPVIKDIKSNSTDIKKNSDQLEIVDFTTKQILLIMQKTTDKDIIAEVKEETEQFRPNN